MIDWKERELVIMSEARGKKEIREAFWILYKEKRIEKITVKEICEKAGYNRSTFYKYYQDMYQILEEIEDSVISYEEFNSRIIDQALNDTSYEKMLYFIINFFNEKREYLPILLGENGDPGFRQKLIGKLWKGFQLELVDKIDEKNMIRLRFLIEYQLNAVLSLIIYWENESDIGLDEFLDMILALSRNGVVSELKRILLKN